MKKVFTSLFILTALSLIAACSSNSSNSQVSSKEQDSSSVNSSVVSSDSSQPSSSKNSSSSSKRSSSQASQNDNELSTTSGLTIKFNTTGASVETIKWNNTQIAKDGFVVGRCANRIAGGKFSIDGTEYNVSKNDGSNSLHGGAGSGINWRGPFATKAWTKKDKTDSSITFSYTSADGENGYPGQMEMEVKYTLSQEGELLIEYSATTTKDTLCNPTNHLFINLNGSSVRNYDNIKLQISADNYTPLSNQIPTGDISPVENTKFDYRNETAFKGSESYDDNYVLNGTGYRKVATMSSSSTNYKVEVFTDRPGLQLYKAGNGDICLESQMFPDMINQPKFASYGTTILRANETFSSKTAYKFSKIG